MSRPDVFGAAKKERVSRLTFGPNVEALVQKCGAAAHLVPDTLLLTLDLLHNVFPGRLANTASLELDDGVYEMVAEPLMAALQEISAATASARCPHCQPSQPLKFVNCFRTGSMAEGVGDGRVDSGGTSDFDIMLEFDGPFRWATTAEKPADIEPQSAPQLWARPTSKTGFVTLHWVQTTQCSHEEPLEALSATSMRKFMLELCQALEDGNINPTGPAVNITREADVTDGGTDFVFCFYVRGWWPSPDWSDGSHGEAGFLPAAARKDIRQFGVHLVPTGWPGSDTELIEYRISLSRAEVIAANYLYPVQRSTIKAVKGMKQLMKEKGMPVEGLKSYYIKTAVLWLAQDGTCPWTSITEGVCYVLDWIEQHLNAREMPCFFYKEINVVAELISDQNKLQKVIDSISLMRNNATHLLVEHCMRESSQTMLLRVLLVGGAEPLSERHLRHRLGRFLIRSAVHQGITFRQEAPCWNAWWKYVIPRLVRGAPHLLPSWHYMKSATYRQQCHLFMAWSVIDPEDLAREVGETSQNVDLFTLDVTTLTRLLIPTDIHNLVIAPTPVAEWCGWQLQLPPAERPAGLTAELDTPRGRAELLLRPELLLRAIREAIPGAMIMWKVIDDMMEKNWTQNYLPQPSYQWLRETLAQHLSCDLQYNLRVKVQPEMDGPTVVATAGLWRRRLQQLLSGDRLRKAYDAAVSRWPDRWQLVPRYLTEDKTGKQDSSGLAQDREIEKGEQRNEEEEQPSEGLPHPKKWQLLETKHRRQWQDLEQQHHQLLQQLERSDHGEKRSLLHRHSEELRCLGLRHYEECQSLQKIHRDERVELHRRNEEDGQRRWEELDRRQQLQWEGLLQGQKLQWGEMMQSHERESQELEERYPDLRSGEELDRLLEECSSRRQQLGERLQGELERDVKKEIERTQKEMLEKKKKLKKKEKRKQKKQAKKQMENDVKEMKKQQKRKRRRAKRERGPTKGG
ncbi:uncharacterized protein LOC122376107 [Amphibalanus amphitrite]|uniref:uncharacterized protein LOC122376107 n=1 Tax=Amphibalanus amphitrite TaxID=1232801 RepID=UPI001C8FA904|nr:uncharacterized protein LOC122376107 [Amphibalanus amphitrite]